MDRFSNRTAACSIERTRTRTRIILRHDPAFAVGLITHRRGRRGVVRHLAGEICRRLNETQPRRGGFSARESTVGRLISAAKSLYRGWDILPES